MCKQKILMISVALEHASQQKDSNQPVHLLFLIGVLFSHIPSVLQIRRGKRDNLGINFHISLLKGML